MTSEKYSLLMGIWKTIKNGLIFWLPALIAFLSNVDVRYSVVAGFIIYLLKNYIENK